MSIEDRLNRIVEESEELKCGCRFSGREWLYVKRRPVAIKRLLLGAPKGVAVVHGCGPDGLLCCLGDSAGFCVEASHYTVMTLSDHTKQRHRNGSLLSPAEYAKAKGRRHIGTEKLTADQRMEIMSLRARNVSLAELAECYGVDESTISRLVRGQTWRPQTHGF